MAGYDLQIVSVPGTELRDLVQELDKWARFEVSLTIIAGLHCDLTRLTSYQTAGGSGRSSGTN